MVQRYLGRKERIQGIQARPRNAPKLEVSLLKIDVFKHFTNFHRNIDRILTSADPDANQGLLSFKDHGLVLCEIYLLQEYAKSVLPKDVLGDFTEEMEDLADIRKKIRRQRKIVKRVRWAFAKWIH